MDQDCFADEKGTETLLALLTVDRGGLHQILSVASVAGHRLTRLSSFRYGRFVATEMVVCRLVEHGKVAGNHGVRC